MTSSRRKARRSSRTLLLLLLVPATFAALWLGLVPHRFSPFAPLDLNEKESWFLNLRLAALKNDSTLCLAVLKPPVIEARAVADEPVNNGCGWHNAVHVESAGGARIGADKLTCDMGAALAMWLTHEVQPAAEDILHARLVGITHMGTYACRNIAGSASLAKFRSQHARANAIDVEAFVFADGRKISVARYWKGDGAEAQFLRRIHRSSCRYFRVALGPDFNAAHTNHFHLDRGAFQSCR